MYLCLHREPDSLSHAASLALRITHESSMLIILSGVEKAHQQVLASLASNSIPGLSILLSDPVTGSN